MQICFISHIYVNLSNGRFGSGYELCFLRSKSNLLSSVYAARLGVRGQNLEYSPLCHLGTLNENTDTSKICGNTRLVYRLYFLVGTLRIFDIPKSAHCRYKQQHPTEC